MARVIHKPGKRFEICSHAGCGNPASVTENKTNLCESHAKDLEPDFTKEDSDENANEMFPKTMATLDRMRKRLES